MYDFIYLGRARGAAHVRADTPTSRGRENGSLGAGATSNNQYCTLYYPSITEKDPVCSEIRPTDRDTVTNVAVARDTIQQ